MEAVLEASERSSLGKFASNIGASEAALRLLISIFTGEVSNDMTCRLLSLIT